MFNNDVLNVNIKTVVDDDNNIWFKGEDIATYLGYQNTVEAIKDHVDEKYKISFGNLMSNISHSKTLCVPSYDKNVIYNKEAG